MTVRLVDFAYVARGSTGWRSPVLGFGASLTAVGGENGSGKTPVMKGILSALGHEVSLDPDIVRYCAAARLTMDVAGRHVVISRKLGTDFLVEVADGPQRTTYQNEAEFSTWMLEVLGILQRRLTTRGRDESQIYMNIFYPLLWVDQDTGWTTLYAPPATRNFIESQYEEMVRVVLGLPARHPFRSRDDYDKAKLRLASIEKYIDVQRALLLRLRETAAIELNDEPALRQRRDELRGELALLEEALDGVRSVTERYDQDIAQLEERRRMVLSSRFSLRGRQRQLDLALAEIDGEVEVLAANVQATDLLKEFCGNPACKVFQPHSESYGRTLLFLKDQIKDLRSADGTLAKEEEALSLRVLALDAELQRTRSERESAVHASPHAQAQARIAALTKALVDVELRLSKLEQVSREAQRFERALEEREQQGQVVQSLKPKGLRRDESAAADARLRLAKRMDEWLDTLRTPNLPRGVSVDESFELIIRGEVFSRDSSISGSTRTRVVLAFHAALLETALDVGGNHPGWLLLDAPKQHELSQRDLNAYIGRLSEVSSRHPGRVQTVFSIANTEAPLPLREGDVRWMPTYGTGAEAKYLWPTDDFS